MYKKFLSYANELTELSLTKIHVSAGLCIIIAELRQQIGLVIID